MTEPRSDRDDRVCVSTAGYKAPIHDREDRAFGLTAAFAAYLTMRRIWRLPFGQQ
jgi:hypothetical protein